MKRVTKTVPCRCPRCHRTHRVPEDIAPIPRLRGKVICPPCGAVTVPRVLLGAEPTISQRSAKKVDRWLQNA